MEKETPIETRVREGASRLSGKLLWGENQLLEMLQLTREQWRNFPEELRPPAIYIGKRLRIYDPDDILPWVKSLPKR